MLKFIKHHMTSIDGIEIFPVISLLIFTIFFTMLIIYAIKLPKSFVKEMKESPIADTIEPQPNTPLNS